MKEDKPFVDWNRPALLRRTFSRGPRRMPMTVTQHFRGSCDEFDILASPRCEINCMMNLSDPKDVVILRERLDALEIMVRRENGKLVPYTTTGREIDGESFEAADVMMVDLLEYEDAILSSLQERGTWIIQWVRLKRTTEYTGARHPFVLVDSVDPLFGLQPVAMARESAEATGIPFLPISHRGGPVSINGAMSAIGSGMFKAYPGTFGGLWQVERVREGRPAECLHRAVALFRALAGR